MSEELWDTRGIRRVCATICALLLAAPILYRGDADLPIVGVIDGSISAAAWFASASIPLFYEPARRWQAISLMLNSVAAAATAGAVITTIK